MQSNPVANGLGIFGIKRVDQSHRVSCSSGHERRPPCSFRSIKEHLLSRSPRTMRPTPIVVHTSGTQRSVQGELDLEYILKEPGTSLRLLHSMSKCRLWKRRQS